jgi:hypothetical protein
MGKVGEEEEEEKEWTDCHPSSYIAWLREKWKYESQCNLPAF